MSMAEVIESIEREALREAQSREIGGRNGEPIDCSNLEDELVIVANNEADRQKLYECFYKQEPIEPNNKKCNLTFCRYNTDRECTNDEKRKECVEVAEKVLCVDKEKFMDEIREADEKQAGRCCVRMEMIIDFIKSWFYYAKMKKYLKDRCCIYYSQSRLNYALWHCKFSKKIEKAKQNIDNNDISEWTCQYQQEPIIRK